VDYLAPGYVPVVGCAELACPERTCGEPAESTLRIRISDFHEYIFRNTHFNLPRYPPDVMNPVPPLVNHFSQSVPHRLRLCYCKPAEGGNVFVNLLFLAIDFCVFVLYFLLKDSQEFFYFLFDD